MVLDDLYPEVTAAGICRNGFGRVPPSFATEIGQQIWHWDYISGKRS